MCNYLIPACPIPAPFFDPLEKLPEAIEDIIVSKKKGQQQKKKKTVEMSKGILGNKSQINRGFYSKKFR